ncbi:MAG: hypothetical protein FGM54_04050 [Chitinophagaceae bacterium]|nr:hypothetical protein [Chitinophagaceae bacterium]
MKQYAVLLGLLLCLGTSSCKKNYKCVCTASTGTVEYPISESRKKHATSACDTYQKQWSGSLNGTCTLVEVPK